jgi:hypothetical protein
VQLDPLSIALPALHSCDVEQLRDRFLRGRVTRMVGTWDAEHGARIGFEALCSTTAAELDVVMDTSSGTALVFEGLPNHEAADRMVLVGRSAHDDARQAGAVAWADLQACTAGILTDRRRH